MKNKLFSALILSVMLVCNIILPVCAEEVEVLENESVEEVAVMEGTAEEAESAELVEIDSNVAEKKVPEVTTPSVEWKGGDLRVPVCFGDYAVDDFRIEVMVNGKQFANIMEKNLITKDYVDIPLLEKRFGGFDKLIFFKLFAYFCELI